MVLIAIILFKSLLTNPVEAATKAVVAPTRVITNKAVGLYSKIGELLSSRYNPAVTKVAACNNAETGVGASIDPGNQLCKGICADFAEAPTNNNKAIIVIAVSFK